MDYSLGREDETLFHPFENPVSLYYTTLQVIKKDTY